MLCDMLCAIRTASSASHTTPSVLTLDSPRVHAPAVAVAVALAVAGAPGLHRGVKPCMDSQNRSQSEVRSACWCEAGEEGEGDESGGVAGEGVVVEVVEVVKEEGEGPCLDCKMSWDR